MTTQPRFNELLVTPTPPELGPGPRAGVRRESELKSLLSTFFRETKISLERQDLIRALVLLWHDHSDSAHELAQAAENADGALVHAILHRREPDYSNATYWFRRVGQHPAFPEIARRVAALLDARGKSNLREKFVPNHQWDPCAFIDACRQASTETEPQIPQSLLIEIQQIEFRVLLEWLALEGGHNG